MSRAEPDQLMKRILIVLVASLLPSLAGATVVPGPETAASMTAVDVAAFDQADGLIATDGTSFLAVWTDSDLQGLGDIHASRVAEEGVRVDDTPILVAAGADPEDRPSLAWGGGRYLVVWSTAAKLQARFVAPDGTLAPVFDLAAVTGTTKSEVAFNGRVFLVLWEAAGLRIRGAIIDTNGVIVKTFDAASSEATYLDTALVAAGGTFYYVTAKIDSSGTPTGGGFPSDVGLLPIDENGNAGTRIVAAPPLSIAFDLHAAARGDEVLVAWTTARGMPGGEIRSVRVTAAGPGPMDAFAASEQWLQDVVAEPSGFVLIYGDEREHLGTRSGNGANPFAITAPALVSTVSDAASNGTRTVLVTRGAPRSGFEHGPAGGDLYVQRLDSAVVRPLSVAPRHQQAPDVATAEQSGVRLAVWCEYIGADRRLGVMAQRIAADGRRLDESPIDLRADVYHPVAPRVASDGENWLVVWTSQRVVYGMRVAADGSLPDAQPLVIASDVYESGDVAVSWDRARYVAVFLRGEFLRGLKTEVKAAYVTATGLVQTPELTLSGVGANETPAIASHFHRSLIVWYSAPTIQAALLSGGSIVPVSFPHIVAAVKRPAVGENDITFLVATAASGPFGKRLEWSIVDMDGHVSVPQAQFLPIDATLSALTYGYPMVELEPDLPNFLLYYSGVGRDHATRATTIYAARISDRGQLLDEPVAVGTAMADYGPSFGASGRTVAYAHRIGHTTREVMRTFYRDVEVAAKTAKRRAVR